VRKTFTADTLYYLDEVAGNLANPSSENIITQKQIDLFIPLRSTSVSEGITTPS
jgi:hypothetical protein